MAARFADAVVVLLAFCALLLLQAAAANRGDSLLLDWMNLFLQKSAHLLFSFFSPTGSTFELLGGTLGQLLVPLLLAARSFWQGPTAALAFGSFWFFENFLSIGAYMADARTYTLPLAREEELHDWMLLFSRWQLLNGGSQIGNATRIVGWVGMLASAAWLVWMTRRTKPVPAPIVVSHLRLAAIYETASSDKKPLFLCPSARCGNRDSCPC